MTPREDSVRAGGVVELSIRGLMPCTIRNQGGILTSVGMNFEEFARSWASCTAGGGLYPLPSLGPEGEGDAP